MGYLIPEAGGTLSSSLPGSRQLTYLSTRRGSSHLIAPGTAVDCPSRWRKVVGKISLVRNCSQFTSVGLDLR